jgi:hypothetical protein
MNAGPADTRSPHLDLEDLIAEVTGQSVDDPARKHLARCEHCRAEASRWDLVAGGIRGLAAALPEAAQPAQPEAAQPAQPEPARPAQPRRTRLRVLTGPRRHIVLAAGTAAVLALLVTVGYGAITGLTGHGSGTALTAVSGCARLEQADGTLEQMNGSSLVIKTASGQPVTVTTTASTLVGMSGALLSDIKDGASVIVLGRSSGGTIAAAIVTVWPPSRSGGTPPTTPPGSIAVQGTVSDASTAGFTVVTSSGARVRVTTTGGTLVTVRNASLGQLQVGATTFAIGQAGPDGTLSARAVSQVLQLPAGVHINVSVHGCSPSEIADAIGAPGSGG